MTLCTDCVCPVRDQFVPLKYQFDMYTYKRGQAAQRCTGDPYEFNNTRPTKLFVVHVADAAHKHSTSASVFTEICRSRDAALQYTASIQRMCKDGCFRHQQMFFSSIQKHKYFSVLTNGCGRHCTFWSFVSFGWQTRLLLVRVIISG